MFDAYTACSTDIFIFIVTKLEDAFHLVVKGCFHTLLVNNPTKHYHCAIKASSPSPCDAACLSCLDRISQLSAVARAPARRDRYTRSAKGKRGKEISQVSANPLSVCVCVYGGTKGLSHRS